MTLFESEGERRDEFISSLSELDDASTSERSHDIGGGGGDDWDTQLEYFAYSSER
jgi:hypothetical protein